MAPDNKQVQSPDAFHSSHKTVVIGLTAALAGKVISYGPCLESIPQRSNIRDTNWRPLVEATCLTRLQSELHIGPVGVTSQTPSFPCKAKVEESSADWGNISKDCFQRSLSHPQFPRPTKFAAT